MWKVYYRTQSSRPHFTDEETQLREVFHPVSPDWWGMELGREPSLVQRPAFSQSEPGSSLWGWLQGKSSASCHQGKCFCRPSEVSMSWNRQGSGPDVSPDGVSTPAFQKVCPDSGLNLQRPQYRHCCDLARCWRHRGHLRRQPALSDRV